MNGLMSGDEVTPERFFPLPRGLAERLTRGRHPRSEDAAGDLEMNQGADKLALSCFASRLSEGNSS